MKTFEEIAPLWSKAIREKGWPDGFGDDQFFEIDGHRLNLEKPEYCIVGEARGFSDVYSSCFGNLHSKDPCEVCDRLSFVFFYLAKGKDSTVKAQIKEQSSYLGYYKPLTFSKAKKLLVDHINEEHVSEEVKVS